MYVLQIWYFKGGEIQQITVVVLEFIWFKGVMVWSSGNCITFSEENVLQSYSCHTILSQV